MSGHDEPADGPEKLPAEIPLAELKVRAGLKFSGATGAVVGSGRGEDTTAPTYGLAKSVFKVIEDLPPVLFDRWAAQSVPVGSSTSWVQLAC